MSRVFVIHQVNIEKFNDLLDRYYSEIAVTSIAPGGSLLYISVALAENAAFENMYDFSRKALELRSA